MTGSDSLLVSANYAALMCGMGRTTWYKLVSTGKAPRPVKLGRLARWRRDELEAWIADGCPSRQKWDALWTGKHNHQHKKGISL